MMKKNLKVGLMAGLLITPAIIAQAGEVEASETPTPFNVVAPITAEDLLKGFKIADEELTAAKLTQERTIYNTYKDKEEYAEVMPIIDAKLTYLESFLQLKQDAAIVKNLISKLTNANKNLVADRSAAQDALDKLKMDLENNSIELNNAVSSHAGTFLETLLYYDEKGQTDFVTKYVTQASLSNLESFEEQALKIDLFIQEHIGPITTSIETDTFNKESYIIAVANARTAFNAINDSTFKNVLKVQIVENNTGIEQYLKNAESDIKKSQTVEDKITDLVQNPPTTATFNSKVNALVKEYEQLTDVQKKLVLNADELKPFATVLNVVNEISRLSKLPANTEEFREEVEKVENLYNALDPLDIRLVVNFDKLVEMTKAIESAVKVEGEITKIDTATYEEKSSIVADARKAYNALSTIERKYVLKDTLDLLASWEKSSSTAANINKQIDAIKTEVFANMDDEKLADTRKISATTSFVTKVRTAESSYAKIKAEEGKTSKEQELVKNRARLEALLPIAKVADQVVTLKVTSETYADDLITVQGILNTWDTFKSAIPPTDAQNIEKLHVFLKSYLEAQQTEQTVAVQLDADILALQDPTSIDLQKIVLVRETYNSLSANGKRLVKNIKVLTDIERANKAALDTIKAIDAIDVEAKDFARKTTIAEASFNKLSDIMKATVTNAAKLEELLPIAKLMQEIDAIRPTATDFKEKLSMAQNKFDQLLNSYTPPEEPTTDLDIIKTKLLTDYGKKLLDFQGIITSASTIEQRIDALKTKSGEVFIKDLAEVSAVYKALDSTVKRSVSNSKLLTELERDYKASLRVIDQIEKLPVHTDRTFSSKVAAAQKAYDRLTEKQEKDVYNYVLKLRDILKVADLIDRIEKLRVGSKTYEIDVAAIRAEYALLSLTEQELVHNITKLATAESGVSSAKEVMALINIAIPTAEGYIEKLIAARNSYDSLSKSDQKLVINFKDLTTRERAVKPVLKLDADILGLDPSNARTFISKYNAADKAYEKLSMSERSLLLNTEKFLGDFTSIFKVMNAINSIKPSSKTFVEETQAARVLFNALPANLASQISNLSTLQEHELNVEGGAKVDAMIRALNSVPPNEFISKIKEAREAFKSLNSANKKGVTLESELKEQEKYIKPIEAAINAIEGLSNPRNDLSRQFNTVNNALKKLDDKQKQYVNNMDQYSNLSNVIHVYTLIAGLKPNDKYFQGNMEAAKLAYDKLSEEEKLKVTNYYKLQQAVLDMTEVQKVMTIIASLNSTSSNFETDVSEALAAYKALPSGSKRQVLNYSELQQAERDLKAAQRVIKQIDDLDSTLRTYASRAKSAKTAFERLTVNQKALVKNYNKLQAAIFELGL
ncbi:hypothetical protein NYE67_03430 [Solibacillus sp. FSL W8-0474]|uniref:hypothetical protein n=1 Tax=Solibacillus sp. FSL W8-0474 TaxID=2975336 RepID=UPI0030F61034